MDGLEENQWEWEKSGPTRCEGSGRSWFLGTRYEITRKELEKREFFLVYFILHGIASGYCLLAPSFCFSLHSHWHLALHSFPPHPHPHHIHTYIHISHSLLIPQKRSVGRRGPLQLLRTSTFLHLQLLQLIKLFIFDLPPIHWVLNLSWSPTSNTE